LSHELSGILEDVNTTLQGLPIPRFKGAVELLKDLNEKWKNNTPIYLVAEEHFQSTMLEEDGASEL